jgi:hypothetical protein
MGASNLGQVIEEGGQVNAPLSGFSYRHPILGPVASMVIPGAHSPNSAIAAHAIANEAQKERNFTYRHPIASTFLHGLIPGAGTAYAIAAAKIEDRKEKAASNLMKRSINNNAFY